MKTYSIGAWRYWYDRHVRAWFTAKYDENGNQLTPCENAYTKREIIAIARYYNGKE